MGLFTNRGPRDAKPQLVTATSDDLIRIGRTAYGGESTHPPGLGALPNGELDGYAMAALERGGYPMGDPSAWERYIEQALAELLVLGERGGSWAQIGAWPVAWNLAGTDDLQRPRYLEIVDRALAELRLDGVPYTAVPRDGIGRWEARYGRDGIRPAGWPSALKQLMVPSGDDLPFNVPPALGESRRLAERTINGGPNYTIVELRDDGTFQAVIDGIDAADGVRKTWDLEQVSSRSYDDLLKQLGEFLVTPSTWAHDDLLPYFPCRLRSRDELRVAARNFQLSALVRRPINFAAMPRAAGGVSTPSVLSASAIIASS